MTFEHCPANFVDPMGYDLCVLGSLWPYIGATLGTICVGVAAFAVLNWAFNVAQDHADEVTAKWRADKVAKENAAREAWLESLRRRRAAREETEWQAQRSRKH